jgi:hypothetical protein
MKIQLITVATHNEGSFNELINNKYNINVKVLGMGEKWKNFKMKYELVYNYINTLHDDNIIIFLDGFDSYIHSDLTEAYKRFKYLKSKVLFSKDIDQSHIGLNKNVFPKCKNNLILNTGLYMGYVKYLKIIFKKLLLEKCNDDQVITNKLCHHFKFIDIDNDEFIFKNIDNSKNIDDEIKKSNALFYQVNGTLSYKRIYRSIFEYSQFFLKYVLFLYILTLFIIYSLKNKLKIKCFLTIIMTFFLFLYLYLMDKSCI